MIKRISLSLLDKWPGKKLFGKFRFLPFYFLAGAGLEFVMINWHFGEVNFCKYIIMLGVSVTVGILLLLFNFLISLLKLKSEWRTGDGESDLVMILMVTK